MIQYPKISIITPSFNQGQYIEEAILSVIGQNYPHLEYIIIDGGSTDNTVEIIRKYEEHLAYWVSEPDKGIYDAMNKGIQKSTGEWLYFLGTDDVLCEGVLISLFSDNQFQAIDFLYGDVQFRHQMKIYDNQFDHLKLINANICHQSIFFSKKIFLKKGLYDLNYQVYADWYYNIKCFGDQTIKILFTPTIICIYNEQGFSFANKDEKFRQDKALICIKYLKPYISNRDFFLHLDDQVFNIIRYKNFFIGWYYIFVAIISTGRVKYYLKNAFFWSKSRFLK